MTSLAAIFLDPINALEPYWMWLILPISAAIAVVYKTLRLSDLSKLVSESVRLTLVIVISMVGAGAALYALVESVNRY